MRPLIIGVGNDFRQEDQIGLYLVRQLMNELSQDYDLCLSRGDAFELMDQWRGRKHVFVIDALLQTAGDDQDFFFWEAHKETPQLEKDSSSSHSFGLVQALELSRILGCLPAEVVVIGVPVAKAGWGPSSMEAFGPMVKKIKNFLLGGKKHA